MTKNSLTNPFSKTCGPVVFRKDRQMVDTRKIRENLTKEETEAERVLLSAMESLAGLPPSALLFPV